MLNKTGGLYELITMIDALRSLVVRYVYSVLLDELSYLTKKKMSAEISMIDVTLVRKYH